MPLPQLHFMMRQLRFSSRENKGVNEAKTWTLCAGLLILLGKKMIQLFPQHQLLCSCGKENWPSETWIPTEQGKLIHPCFYIWFTFSICPQENQRRMISIGSNWLLQYSQTTSAIFIIRSLSVLPMTAPRNSQLHSGILAPGQQQVLLSANHQLQEHGCPGQEEVLPKYQYLATDRVS